MITVGTADPSFHTIRTFQPLSTLGFTAVPSAGESRSG